MDKKKLSERDICTKSITPTVQAAGWDTQGQMREEVGLTQLKNCLFPMPPLAEQSRIVARVEALRALCGQLRQRLAASRDTQGQLASALLAQG